MHLAIFDGVYASDKHNNLVGEKSNFLKNQFENYTYIGDNKKDIPVLQVQASVGLL